MTVMVNRNKHADCSNCMRQREHSTQAQASRSGDGEAEVQIKKSLGRRARLVAQVQGPENAKATAIMSGAFWR